jgi:hypothetical protein
MNESQKAIMYGQLLNEHTRLRNQIADIKSENFELNQDQLSKIRQLENQQIHIMMSIKKLMS